MSSDRAIVTGASAGIGLAAARRLADAGWAVTNVSRRRCPDERVESLACDMTDPTALEETCGTLARLVDDARHTVLIHNASLLQNDVAGEL